MWAHRKGGAGKAYRAGEGWAKGMRTIVPQTAVAQACSSSFRFTPELASRGVSAFGEQLFLQILAHRLL